MTTPLRCLLVEDSEDDAKLILRHLREDGYQVTPERVDTPEAMQAALDREPWDIIISDYKMPRFSGMAALELARASGLDLPFIIVSGTIGEESAVEAMKAGAHDYVMKDRLARLVSAVQREVYDARERSERRQTEAYREIGLEVLRILNQPGDLADTLRRVVAALKTGTGFDAVGIRLQDGTDFPYFAHHGFSKDFLLTENTLVARAPDGRICLNKDGTACLGGACGLVISGRTDPANPHFTPGGSYWLNDTFPLLAIPASEDPRLNPRNQCFHHGYASVALVPIRNNDRIIGLIQLNDRRKGRFIPATVEILEGIAAHLGGALMRKQAEDALRASHQFIEGIMNAIPVRVFWKDKNSVYLGCNMAFAQDAGYAGPKDIIGKDDHQMVWREQAEGYRGDDSQVISSGQSKMLFEETQTTPTGETTTVLSSKLPLRDAQSEIMGVLGTYMDITARKRAQESHNRLAMAVEQASETIVITDTEGTILYANPAFEKTSGYSCAEAHGQNSRILKSGKHDAEFYTRMWETLRRGETWSGHLINRRKEGTFYEEEATLSPVRDATGTIINFVAVKRDVTHEMQLEAQFRQSQENAEEVLRKVSRQEKDRKKKGILLELVVVFGLGTLTFAVLKHTNYLQTPLDTFIIKYRNDLDEVFGALVFMLVGFFLFSYRRWQKVKSQVGEQANIEVALRILHGELEKRIEQRTAELSKSNNALLTEIAGRKKMELERQKLEEQYRQAQKMEAIGQLAGGVAHDFNNILAVIQMQSELLKRDGGLSNEQSELADEIGVSVQRATALTRQLLLFSRREVFQPRDLDLNEAISTTTKMLKRMLGETIEMHLKLSAQPLFLHADAGMLDQVLMNLCVNARDAMPNGGQLAIETAGVEFDELTAAQTAQARPGSFVRLSVSDNGSGIPPEILPQIFEPFFTTKDVGKGTGLGLATVFGIVQQHQGWINVFSEVGHGTTFRIYLPRLTGNAVLKSSPTALAAMRGGRETILLAEDDPALRVAVRKALSKLGYRILEAPTGVKALEVWKENRDEIRLLGGGNI
jgi:PAS domain S-box-containing protein